MNSCNLVSENRKCATREAANFRAAAKTAGLLNLLTSKFIGGGIQAPEMGPSILGLLAGLTLGSLSETTGRGSKERLELATSATFSESPKVGLGTVFLVFLLVEEITLKKVRISETENLEE